jgi:hypothetical protein
MFEETGMIGLPSDAQMWLDMRNYIDKNNLVDFDWSICLELVTKIRNKKNLSIREISFGKRTLEYIKENPIIIDEIKALSKLEETEIIEVKFIFDKLQLLTKEEWKRIIDLATQTNLFNNLELANVKQVQNSLQKKEIVKEQTILKCYESLLKLKKFNIII